MNYSKKLRLAICVLSAVLTVVFTSCAFQGPGYEPLEVGSYESESLPNEESATGIFERTEGVVADLDPEIKVKMYVVPNSVSQYGAKVRLINNTDYEMSYGLAYRIETLTDDNWVALDWLPSESEYYRGFFGMAIILRPRTYHEFNLNWEIMYGELSDGVYRIVRDVFMNNEQGERLELTAEFTILTTNH